MYVFATGVNSKVVYNNSSPTYVNAKVKKNAYLNLSLSQYVISASPDIFNLSCSMNKAVYFALSNTTRHKLHSILVIPGHYICVIVHEAALKTFTVHLNVKSSTKPSS